MNFKKAAFVAAAGSVIVFAQGAQAVELTGAGASFPYPIYAKWAEAYKTATGTQLNYQSIGSGGGIKQITGKTVDLGASDMPLKAEQLAQDHLFQFPAVMGGIVTVYNLPGVKAGALKLDGKIIGDIYRGKITEWNAPEIAKMNPGVKLPAMPITVVYRADSSGTSYVFTSYVSKTNGDFKTEVGAGTSVKWPVGIGGKGNEGVAANVLKIKGAFGYVEYAYAKKNNLAFAELKSHDGEILSPSLKSFQAAAEGADWKSVPSFGLDFTDAPGKNSWPITSATFILLQQTQDDPAKAKEVLKFFNWSFMNGQAAAESLDYVPLPAPLVKMIEADWKTGLKDSAGKAVW